MQHIDLKQVLTKDKYYLQQLIKLFKLAKTPQEKNKQQLQIDKLYQLSNAQYLENLANLPKITERGDLPISLKWDEIKSVINNNQVTIICGHTGSGKTTKIPQICLDLGLGAKGKIGHTQPRRLAARSVSARIASELNVELGDIVGYQVRFEEKRSKKTQVMLVTDGILLAEIQQDKYLKNYEVIIIDEAHERSLNIDFLLGYLRKILPQRSDLKIIITSATIDPERFSKHFNNAPIITVEGKTFPIETIYQNRDDNEDLYSAVANALHLVDDIHYGDTLVFLPTERDIRDVGEELSKLNLRNTEVLALFARQSAATQKAIFYPNNKRRIILATNVAETSVTLPRILNVIDSGLVRISRYSHRSKLQRLPIEAISKASANQRQGRCGRIAKGVCVRLYSAEDFLTRDEYTDPEITRTSLASVILQMTSLKIGKIENFPFLEAPDDRMINDGYKLLFELEAVDNKNQITKLGLAMSRLPIDPRFAKILLIAKEKSLLNDILPIVAALSIGDIKDRPQGQEPKADEKHRAFADKQSDFLFFLNVFYAIYPIYQKSKNQSKKFAQNNFLSVIRSREWIYLIEQLAELLNHNIELDFSNKTLINEESANPQINNSAKYALQYDNYQQIHTTLLPGFIDHVGLYQKDSYDFLGVRNRHFNIFPGSFLAKKKFDAIMCGEIVESSRVFARQVAKIEIDWLESLTKHLVKTREYEPRWYKSKQNVMAKQEVLLYGLPIVKDRNIVYAHINITAAHDIFVRHALVENDINTKIKEIAQNHANYERILDLEERSRNRNLLIDENSYAQLYFQILPPTIYSTETLETWYKTADSATKKSLLFTEDKFYLTDNEQDLENVVNDYPDSLLVQNQHLQLDYVFDPTSSNDGITVNLPLANLNMFSPIKFDYLVPIMLGEKINALIRSLPKRYRRQFVPIDQFSEAICATITKHPELKQQSLVEVISLQLENISGLKIPKEEFDLTKLDKHLLMNFAIKDGDKTIAQNRDLLELQKQYAKTASCNFSEQTQHIFAETFTSSFPKLIAQQYIVDKTNISAFPALINKDKIFKIELFDNQQDAEIAHQNGVLAFIKTKLSQEIKFVKKNINNYQKIALLYRNVEISIGKTNNKVNENDSSVADDIIDAVIINLGFSQYVPRTQTECEQAIEIIRKTLITETQALASNLLQILNNYQQIRTELKPTSSYYADINAQLTNWIYSNFIAQVQSQHLTDITRYTKAILIRLQKAKLNPQKDKLWQAEIAPFMTQFSKLLAGRKPDKNLEQNLLDIAYLLEEYRISIFAQTEVGTKQKVSAKRLEKMFSEIIV